MNMKVRTVATRMAATALLALAVAVGPAHTADAYGSATFGSSCTCSYGIKWCTNQFGQSYNAGYC